MISAYNHSPRADDAHHRNNGKQPIPSSENQRLASYTSIDYDKTRSRRKSVDSDRSSFIMKPPASPKPAPRSTRTDEPTSSLINSSAKTTEHDSLTDTQPTRPLSSTKPSLVRSRSAQPAEKTSQTRRNSGFSRIRSPS